MTNPRFPTRSTIDDELLSAYIDGQVTAAERQRVEQALATDAQVRERYETLRLTVNLMQHTPPLRVPRAFVLSEAQVLAAGGKVKGVEQPGFWGWLFPRFMPLAAAAVAILLVVLLSVDFLPGLGGAATPQPAMQEMEIAAATVREEPAPKEMPAELEAAAAAEIIKKVGRTVVVEKEVARTAEGENLAEREVAGDGAIPEPDAVRSTGIAITPVVVEAPLAAAPPPPAAERMAEDEAEPVLEIAGAESTAAEPTINAAQVSPPADENRTQAWLRPLEFILALLFVIFLAITILLHKQRHTDAP